MKFKSIIVFTTIAAASFQLKAQTTWVADSVTMGPGYTNDVYYDFNHNGAVSSSANTDWHLAFQLLPPGPYGSVAIWANHTGAQVSVYSLHLSGSAHFTTLSSADTVGKTNSAQQLYNADSTWDSGALNANKGGVGDYGWGVYQGPPNHDIVGDSIYLVKVGTTPYKIWVKHFVSQPIDSVKYTFRIAKFDGTEDTTYEIYRKNGFTDRIFAYYNITNKTVSDREPGRGAWDVVFERYIEQIPLGAGMYKPYSVVGALSNYSTSVTRIEHVFPDDAILPPSYNNRLNAIGSTWKIFNMTTSVYEIEDSNSYFIKSLNNNHYYQLQFTRFDGSSTGKIVFQKKNLGNVTSVPTVTNVVNAYAISPNPVNNSANIMLDAKQAVSDAHIVVTDITGKTIQQYTVNVKTGMNGYSISTADFSNGMYIVNIIGHEWKLSNKLIVQH